MSQNLSASAWVKANISRRGLLSASGMGAMGLVLAACGANSSDKVGAAASATAKKGGTLTVLSSSTDINWDPAKSQSLPITSLPLVHRRLVGLRLVEGKPVELVGDLANDTGKVSEDGLTWTFTIKKGLKMQNGQEITTKLIKYGIERSFAPSLSGGLGYHKTLLEGGKNYQGPYNGKHLDSIGTPDDYTITFKLVRPYGDWPWVVSTPTFSPVPTGDDPSTYTRKPVASGPYQVADYKQGVSVTLERNPKWEAKSDPLRSALPDKVVFKLGQDESVANKSIIADAGEAATSMSSSRVAAAQLAEITANPKAKARLATSSAGPLLYLAINTERVKDLAVRQAINYAVNKDAVVQALGGQLGGLKATTYITPGIEGRKEYDLYPYNVNKAKQLIAGKNVPELVLLTPNGQAQVAVAEAVQQSLAKAGFKVRIDPVETDTASERSTNSDGSSYDLTLMSWNPDYPSPAANLQPLFASSEIGNGGINASRFKDEAVDKAIDAASAELDPAKAKVAWAAVDKQIAQQAPAVPLAYRRNSFLRGSKVTGFYAEPYPAYPNYLVLGVE